MKKENNEESSLKVGDLVIFKTGYGNRTLEYKSLEQMRQFIGIVIKENKNLNPDSVVYPYLSKVEDTLSTIWEINWINKNFFSQIRERALVKLTPKLLKSLKKKFENNT